MVLELKQVKEAKVLFEGWEETLIWSCLQGVMGRIYGDSLKNPAAAAALLGDFCFLAGIPKEELISPKLIFGSRDFMILVPENREWVIQYDTYDLYQEYGLGAIILKDGEPVSGASSYAGYMGGIEVEIDTRKDYRRRGLAYICGAKLILECLKRGWYPSWDAHNVWSVALAEKLGYHLDHEYEAYEVMGENACL